ncbi:hypothetical protein AAG906_015418 [Vitis piasezkii]
MFKVERKRQQRLNNLKFLNFLPACLNFVDKLLLAHELRGRITDINTTFEKILVYKKRKEKRLPTVEETNVVGMNNDVEAVKGKLSYFPAESNKSRVVITTRREDIAVDAHSDCYRLQLLGEKESWELFLNKVGSAGLEEFKEEIVAKCKALLSLLWGFPEDSEIKASELIRLWVAEGFVQKRGKETLEDIAEDYLYELIQRSMIQVADARVDGRVKSCRIHDLLRDLAISEAKEEKLFEVDENIDVDVPPTSARRLCIHQNISPHLQNSNLRSLILNKFIDEGDEQMRHLNCYNCRISSRQSMRERSGVPLQIASSGTHPKTTRGNNTLSSESHATQTVCY